MEETHLDQEVPSKKKLIVPIIIILAVIIGALMTIKSTVKKEANLNSHPVELAEGADLPNLELTKLDNTKFELSSLKHKVIMLNFWATWCEACVEEMPSIVALREKYKDQGFEVYGINLDENPDVAAPPMIKKMNMNFPIIKDTENKLAEIFDIHAIPLTLIIGNDRKILYTESGGRDWNDSEMSQLMDKWLRN